MSDFGTPSATRPRLGLVASLRRTVAGGAHALRGARIGRPRPLTVALLALIAIVIGAGWFWLRDSSLVAVDRIQVSGVTGSQQQEVRGALEQAAGSMTTLHVREDALRKAVEPYSIVKDIEVSTDFPHEMRIHVVSNVAVAAVEIGGRVTPVTADGTLLRDVTAAQGLAKVPLHGTPVGTRVKEGEALAALAALGAAPSPLRSRVGEVKTTRQHGLELQLANGPAVWFGDDTRMAAKWAAAAAVIADPDAAGASYIDVTAPERPAVGGLPDGAPASGESDLPVPPAGVEVDPETGAAIESATGDGTDATADPSTSAGAESPDVTDETTP